MSFANSKIFKVMQRRSKTLIQPGSLCVCARPSALQPLSEGSPFHPVGPPTGLVPSKGAQLLKKSSYSVTMLILSAADIGGLISTVSTP